MIIKLKFPKDLGKETEDEIVEWMMEKVKNPNPKISTWYSPFKYICDIEVDR